MVMFSLASVCVCLSVCNVLTFEAPELGSSFCRYIFRISRSRSYIQVIRSRSTSKQSVSVYGVRGWSALAIRLSDEFSVQRVETHANNTTLIHIVNTTALLSCTLINCHTKTLHLRTSQALYKLYYDYMGDDATACS